MLSKILVATILTFSLSTAFAQKKSKTSKVTPSKKEWIYLFNGKDLTGWHNYGKTGVKPQWVVDGDALHLSERGGGDIVTDGQYENFILEWEWKIAENGNSGVFYLVDEDTLINKHVWQSAPEYQILHDEGHPDGKYETHRAGANYDLIAPKPGNTKPVGQYNKSKLVINHRKIEHWLNDVLVVSYEIRTPEWMEMVNKSKFKKFAGYGLSNKGHIALQDHGDKVWYRNIRLKVLK